MITEENKWVVIEAYLAGQLDESGRQEVAQKMTEDGQFQADVLMQYALNQHLDQEQTSQDYALVDKILQEELVQNPPIKPSVRSVPWWQQTWARAAAVVLLIGLCLFGYTRWSKPTVIATRITYEQRGLGVGGTPDSGQLTTFPVEFWLDGTTPNKYSSGPDGLHIYLTNQPIDTAQWRLRDDPATGGFLLNAPPGKTYRLDRDTYNQRKVLQE